MNKTEQTYNLETISTQNRQSSSWWTTNLAAVLAAAYFVCGLITLIGITPSLILGGVLQMIFALAILSIEAPFSVPCLTPLRPVAEFVNHRPVWLRVTVYAVMTFFPYVFCWLSTGLTISIIFILGGLCNMAICFIYALGPKADRAQMRSTAIGGGGVFP